MEESSGKLSDLEQQICGDTFLRCHQSYIVNMYHVMEASGTALITGGMMVPVSRRYAAAVQKRYREIMFEEVDWQNDNS